MEVAEESNQFVLILDQNIENGGRLVGICHKYFENVEGFKLNVSALVTKERHHQFQIFLFADVFGHNIEIGSVQQQLTQKLRIVTATFVREHQPSVIVSELHSWKS